jgi:hypothetical protein
MGYLNPESFAVGRFRVLDPTLSFVGRLWVIAFLIISLARMVSLYVEMTTREVYWVCNNVDDSTQGRVAGCLDELGRCSFVA